MLESQLYIKFCTVITFVESLCPNDLLLCSIMLNSDTRAIMLNYAQLRYESYYAQIFAGIMCQCLHIGY